MLYLSHKTTCIIQKAHPAKGRAPQRKKTTAAQALRSILAAPYVKWRLRSVTAAEEGIRPGSTWVGSYGEFALVLVVWGVGRGRWRAGRISRWCVGRGGVVFGRVGARVEVAKIAKPSTQVSFYL